MKKPKKKKVVIIVGIIIIAGIGGITLKDKLSPKTEDAAVIQEVRAGRDDIKIEFVGDGVVDLPITNLDFEVTGTVSEIYVNEGDMVTKGQKLARLNNDDYQSKVENAELNYQQILLNQKQEDKDYELNILTETQSLENLEREMNEAEDNLDAARQMPDAYSEQEIVDLQSGYDNAKGSYETQLKRVEQLKDRSIDDQLSDIRVKTAEIELQQAKEELQETELYSPQDGEIMYISKSVGESVKVENFSTDEATANTDHFIVLRDPSLTEVSTSVSEIDLDNVYVGQKVEMQFESIEDVWYEGEVTKIASLPLIDNNGVVTYDVRIKLIDQDEKIKNGMNCVINFILKEKDDVLAIPNKAVYMKDGVQMVQVKKGNGTVEEREIVAGFTDGEDVEVESGLEQGETVLIVN